MENKFPILSLAHYWNGIDWKMAGYYIYSRYIFCWENVLQSQQRAWNHIEVLFRQNAFIKSFDQYKARHAITSFIARLSLRVFKTIIKLIKVKTDFLFPAQKKSFFLVCIIILATKLMQGKSLRCKKGETFWERWKDTQAFYGCVYFQYFCLYY